MKKALIFLMLFIPASAFALEIRSASFENAAKIPSKYTCDAQDLSPAFIWSDCPSGTRSFVLICSDPDAPIKPWTHWVIFNIPADKRSLPVGIQKAGRLDDGSIQGINDFGKAGYGGPCPPAGKPHRYLFTLYCLDIILDPNEKSGKDDILRQIKGNVLDEAKTSGVYGR